MSDAARLAIDYKAVSDAEQRLNRVRGSSYVDAQVALLQMAATETAGVHDVLLVAADVLRMATEGERAGHVGTKGLVAETHDGQEHDLFELAEVDVRHMTAL